jgi:hypothetical protein
VHHLVPGWLAAMRARACWWLWRLTGRHGLAGRIYALIRGRAWAWAGLLVVLPDRVEALEDRTMRGTSARGSPGRALEAPAGSRRALAGLAAVPREHALFCSVLLLAAIVRLVVVLGYPPALWFFDSLPYVHAVLPLSPNRVRPIGYSYFLALLEPFHSVWLVTAAQAVMGLAMGTAVYAVLRRYKLPASAAVPAAVPVLLSAHELQIEHYVLSDTLFGLLVTLAVVIVLWWPVPPTWVCGLAGLVLAWATLDREQGVLLPIPFGLFLCVRLARRVPVRQVLTALVAMCVTLALPLLVYAWWFEQSNGSFQLTSGTGVFLYSRVSTFAECSVIKPPADERWLCISTPPAKRPGSIFYAWSATSPINVKPPGGWAFDSQVDSLATNFARRAIDAQRGAYLTAVWHSIADNFEPAFMGSQAWYSEKQYMFPAATPESLRALARANRELPYYQAGYVYDGRRDPSTRIVRPFAGWIQAYQRFVVLPGPLLGLIVLAGLAGIAFAWRRLGGPALLPWLTGAVLIVTPAATANYGARYVVASIPAFCIAAAIGLKDIIDWVAEPDERPEPVS